nr:lysine-rich arabinogalactan protein 19-like [Lolium perenne]
MYGCAYLLSLVLIYISSKFHSQIPYISLRIDDFCSNFPPPCSSSSSCSCSDRHCRHFLTGTAAAALLLPPLAHPTASLRSSTRLDPRPQKPPATAGPPTIRVRPAYLRATPRLRSILIPAEPPIARNRSRASAARPTPRVRASSSAPSHHARRRSPPARPKLLPGPAPAQPRPHQALFHGQDKSPQPLPLAVAVAPLASPPRLDLSSSRPPFPASRATPPPRAGRTAPAGPSRAARPARPGTRHRTCSAHRASTPAHTQPAVPPAPHRQYRSNISARHYREHHSDTSARPTPAVPPISPRHCR